MKTALKWFNDLSEPWRSAAIRNSETKMLKVQHGCIEDALLASFDWGKTEEGHDAWAELCFGNTSLKGMPQEPKPILTPLQEAAPELLEALESALVYASHPIHGNNAHAASTCVKIKAAIAKAKGGEA